MSDEFHWLYERDLKPLSRKELEDECKIRGIKTNVKRKATLINRILQWQEDQDPPGEDGDDSADGYEIDQAAEEEARRAFEDLDKRANAREERDEMEEEDDFGSEVEEVFPEQDSAWDKDDEAANEAYMKKYGSRSPPSSSPFRAILGAILVAAGGYAAWHYINYESPEHAAQMY